MLTLYESNKSARARLLGFNYVKNRDNENGFDSSGHTPATSHLTRTMKKMIASSASYIIMATAIAIVGLLSSSTCAFHIVPMTTARSSSSRLAMIGRESNVDLSGNAWKPDSEKMGVRSQ
jgi:hypothetical protein